MSLVSLSPDFCRRMIDLYGAAGQAWLDDLPALAAELAERWQFRLLPPFTLSYNYVAPVVCADGRRAVLKLGAPASTLPLEIAALQHYAGRGCLQVWQADLERRALLLEYLSPGASLASLDDDDRATCIAAAVMRALWQPLPPQHPFPSTLDWAQGLARLRLRFEGGCGPFPPHLVQAAESLFAELHASQAAPVLLHGDLHHDNILAAQRCPWLAIDPQGVSGEPAYEVGALLRNPIEKLPRYPDLRPLLYRRLDILAEQLELERQRLWGWSLAQAVLSVWWDYEDHGRLEPLGLRVAEALYQLEK